jgi:hypothetical protein
MTNRITALVIIVVAGVGISVALMTAKHLGRSGSAGSAPPGGITESSGAAKEVDGEENRRGKYAKKRLDGEGLPSVSAAQSPSLPVIKRAAEDGKYAFIFFWSDDTEPTESMRKVFRSAAAKMADRAAAVEVNTGDPSEQAVVRRFAVSRAPMPLVLAVAPNGAITGGFPQTFEEPQLLGAFASPCEERSLKALQDRRVVLVCVQNESTELNEAALKGVQDFKADPDFGSSTDIVMLNPADPSESEFLKALQVAPQTKAAVTVCLIPPGNAVATFTGGTRKETIVAALASSKGCGPGGCGPGGCGQ